MNLKLLSASILTIVLILAYTHEVLAIPAFARTHQLPCTMCHVGFPKLNAFGEEFEHHGFRMPGQEGKFLWEQPIPLAGKITLLSRMNIVNWAPSTTDLMDTKSSAIELFDWQLFAGGTLAPKYSYFFQLLGKIPQLTPDGSDGGAGHVHDPTASLSHSDTTIQVHAMWVQLNDLLADDRMNLRVGLDHVDNGFLSSPRRLTHADYLIQIQHFLGASLHHSAYGIDFNGSVLKGLDYHVGLRNYSTAYDSKEGNEWRLGALYAIVSKRLDENKLSLLVSTDRTGDANLGQAGATLAYGVSMDLHVGQLNLIPGFFWYHEQNSATAHAHGGDTGDDHAHDEEETPVSAGSGRNDLNVFSGTLELIYPFRPTLLGTARFDFNIWDHQQDAVDHDAQQYVASLAWYQFPNVRWVIEFSRLTTQNLMVLGEPGLMTFEATSAEADLTQDTILLRLEAAF
jgi:hypothetical protein